MQITEKHVIFLSAIDECALHIANCDQMCVDTVDSFTCSCNPGYVLDTDGHSCNLDCGGTLTEAIGSFQTPFWPERYPQEDFQCKWIIAIPGASGSIEFSIDQTAYYGIDGRPPCGDDHIEFFDGIARNSSSLEKICGSRSMYASNYPPTIVTSSLGARVVFTGSNNPNRPDSRVGVKVFYTIGGKNFHSIRHTYILLLLPTQRMSVLLITVAVNIFV